MGCTLSGRGRFRVLAGGILLRGGRSDAAEDLGLPARFRRLLRGFLRLRVFADVLHVGPEADSAEVETHAFVLLIHLGHAAFLPEDRVHDHVIDMQCFRLRQDGCPFGRLSHAAFGKTCTQAAHFPERLPVCDPVFLPGLHQLLSLAPHFLVEFEPVLLKPVAVALGSVLRFLLRGLHMLKFFGPLGCEVVELVQKGGRVLSILKQIVFGAGDDGLGQTVFAGYVQSLACADLIVGERVKRPVRVRIEKHGGRTGVFAGEGIAFQSRKMRGC